MGSVENQKEMINNVINYKLWDNNIKAIFDSFNWSDDREELCFKEVDFFDNMIWDANEQQNIISQNTPQISMSYNKEKDGKLSQIKFQLNNDSFIDIDQILSQINVKIYDMNQANIIIGQDRWWIIKEDMEHGWACYDKPTNCIFVNQKCIESNLFLAVLLHEIGHASDSQFGQIDIDILNLENITNKQWAEIISSHSRAERYAHAFMLKFLHKYKDISIIQDYIKSAQQLIDHTLMLYKFWYLNHQLWMWKKWIFTSGEYLKLYKKN